MWDGCNDQGRNEKLPPLRDQVVTLSSGGRSVVVARISADPGTAMAQTKVTLPAFLDAGKSTLKLGIAEPVELTVTAR
jgi:hypothetical protein